MRTRVLLYYLFFLFYLNLYGQKNQTITSPLSTTAFDSLVIGNLNFMVLGEDNVKQGLSYEYKESTSELNLSGKLLSKERFIMTLDGKFAIDNGAFVFDESDGSKKGNLTLNFFFNLPWNTKFYKILNADNPEEIDSRRAMFQNKIQTMALADSIYYKIMEYEVIMKKLKFPYVPISDKKFEKQRALLDKIHTSNYDYNPDNYDVKENKDRLFKMLKQYYKKGELVDFDALLAALQKETKDTYQILDNNKNNVDTYNVYDNFKIEKFLKDYQAAYSKLEKYCTENNSLEIATFKKYWTGERSNYMGISPYYERQGFDIYNSSPLTTIGFKDRFEEVRSDLYGVNFSINHIRLFKSRAFYMIRLLGAIGRANNFTEYDKNDYRYTTSTENSNGIPIEVVKTKTGYLNKEGRSYQYGFFNSINLETYFCPVAVAGLYGKIGYSKNNALLQDEAYPLETGILINLKSKDKKNIVAVQLFMSRQNLNVHPDDDMNFGLKVGLPINISRD
ncbi:hypothetical protein [Flavobacterium sp. XGLA_31]|uniref:hypothetical protein n=1 Tax=Flavobacterium sp. XGLA_31 TaxID=3447666 RepID=UPI003F389BFB